MIDSQDIASPRDSAHATPRSGYRLESLVRVFLVRAVLWSGAFGTAHLLGFRDYTAVLFGTVPHGTVQQVLGMLYVVLYVGFVFLVPVLIIAAVLVQGAAWAIAFRMPRNHTKGLSNHGEH